MQAQASNYRQREESVHLVLRHFLESVCGTTAWNNAKTKQLVLEARDQSGSKVVSVSDEAFGLFLIDNYWEKWRKRATEITPIKGEDLGRKRSKTAGNTLERQKDSVSGVAGVPRASVSSIF